MILLEMLFLAEQVCVCVCMLGISLLSETRLGLRLTRDAATELSSTQDISHRHKNVYVPQSVVVGSVSSEICGKSRHFYLHLKTHTLSCLTLFHCRNAPNNTPCLQIQFKLEPGTAKLVGYITIMITIWCDLGRQPTNKISLSYLSLLCGQPLTYINFLTTGQYGHDGRDGSYSSHEQPHPREGNCGQADT